jgi:hypothetical protein
MLSYREIFVIDVCINVSDFTLKMSFGKSPSWQMIDSLSC